MAKKSIKYFYGDIKFTIRDQDGHWHLDYYYKTKRVRGSTKEKSTQNGLEIVKKQIIPDIVFGLGESVVQVEKKMNDKKEQTLAEFASDYFALRLKDNKVREHVHYKEVAHYNNHIAPVFGYFKLYAIGVEELEKWQANLKSLKNKELEPSTKKRIRSVFFGILEKAKKYKRISENPLLYVETVKKGKPKIQKDKNKKIIRDGNIYPFTETELVLIIESTSGYMKNFIQFMVATGMRPGEIVALKWSDIDFNRKKIDVFRTRLRSKIPKTIQDGDTKTDASYRYIDMLALAEEALLKQKKLTAEYEYIFISYFKRPFYTHDVIGVNFHKILKTSGVKDRPLYNLRHTFASQMISRGVDILWVSKTLGHKDASITLKTYAKFIEEDDDKRFKNIAEIDKKMVKLKNSNNENNDT